MNDKPRRERALPRPGRVAPEKMFETSKRPRALVVGSKEDAGDDAKLMIAAGIWLRELREAKQLSQPELQRLAGVRSLSIVSQAENGRVRIQPYYFEGWANAIGMPAPEFVQSLLRFYSPVTFNILFGDDS